MILAVLLFLGGLRGGPAIPVDRLDVNYVEGQYVQVLAREWSHDYQRYDVVAWKIADTLDDYPRHIGGQYFWQMQGKTYVSTECSLIFTLNDIEVENRVLLKGRR